MCVAPRPASRAWLASRNESNQGLYCNVRAGRLTACCISRPSGGAGAVVVPHCAPFSPPTNSASLAELLQRPRRRQRPDSPRIDFDAIAAASL